MAKTVNYTPNDPDNCVPTSGIVCVYCKNHATCPSKLERNDLNRPDNYIPMDDDYQPKKMHDFTN